ncbi:PREDICTED: protein WEAK CHLOROPLAST MOVEMENT UNDER BLUE LIGHT 1-like [Nelumbo nucifera]|uniref:Protein WEAK CHLOROPLAST MOVEMENT UNDER BLUE LIGHT 1-like n=1 Tax=Nelumbo nucifera TaxID=4432 RepID=A0A1U8ACT9_NELNU|nr:PREDICTED: protein WEAK CHLOROPLAST MOVEMENT UNDER BLUE LIGHT 1-like [Nelumbo nucifera]XP_019053695.1 PREDICTED: protein WEAK CHLOROPLAST MOVEMENT UNDER BLUE LIGHT 1-like [Nelumbo nucifera]
MGEVDTKSIESVQAVLSLFEEKKDQRKYCLIGNEEVVKGMELDLMLKYLANYKVQLEVKESAYMQALLKIEVYQKTVDELSIQLKNAEAERDKYIKECQEARVRIEDLESKIKEMSDQLLETGKAKEQLIYVVSELKTTKEELLSTEAKLAAAEESNLSAIEQAKLIETSIDMEKKKSEELLKHLSEINKAMFHFKLEVIEAEKEKSTIISEKDGKIQMSINAAVQAQEQLEEMRIQATTVQDLDNQHLAKSQSIDLPQKLKQDKEIHNSFAEAASGKIDDLNQLKSELIERANSVKESDTKSMDSELRQLELELKNAREEVCNLRHEIKFLKGTIQKSEKEMEESKERESEAQVHIAMLKSELHRDRSKIAAAEAAEARAKSVKSGLYLAVQQLAIEADEAKKETQRLRRVIEKAKEEADEETGNSASVKPQFLESSSCLKLHRVGELKPKVEEVEDNMIPISQFQ